MRKTELKPLKVRFGGGQENKSMNSTSEEPNSQEARFCVDVLSPAALRQISALESRPDLDAGDRVVLRAIMPVRTEWPNGSVLRVRFMGGSSGEHDNVKRIASEWMQHANIKLEFDNSPQAEIRISFVQDGRSWSYLGTDCLNIPRHAATMNFGWPLEQRTILHEFGHALGLAHEHQNPEGGIEWDQANVIRDLSGPPNFWDQATIHHNVLSKYSMDQIRGTEFDRKSIMLYSFPRQWTVTGFQAPLNNVLSELDKRFVGERYFRPPVQEEVELPVIDLTGVPGEIARAGEENLYKFNVTSDGSYTVETTGPTDVVMKLFGPDSRTNLIAEDDDGGVDLNSRIVRNLAPGEYYAQVRHFDSRAGTGPYRIRVIQSS
jgi:hypothetical protein